MGFPMTPRLMTLDDLDCCKVKCWRSFTCFRDFGSPHSHSG